MSTSPLTAPPVPQIAPIEGRRIRWGIMATGHIAEEWAKALNQVTDEAEITCVGSRSLDKAESFAAEVGASRGVGSYREVAEAEDVDVVYVASPHSEHLDNALLAIEAGKHVLVEKPLTPTAADSLRLIEAAAERGVFCMEAMWSRCHPLVRQTRAMVVDGTLGDPRLLRADFAFHFEGEDSHRLLNPELAGGAILDLGVYPAHIAHFLLGRPDAVSAKGTLTHTGVDGTGVLSATWTREPATFGTLWTSLDATGNNTLELLGTKGRLLMEHFIEPRRVVLSPTEGEPQDFTSPQRGYVWQAQEVHRCLALGLAESELVPWQATLDVAWMLDEWRAGVEAFAEGQS